MLEITPPSPAPVVVAEHHSHSQWRADHGPTQSQSYWAGGPPPPHNQISGYRTYSSIVTCATAISVNSSLIEKYRMVLAFLCTRKDPEWLNYCGITSLYVHDRSD